MEDLEKLMDWFYLTEEQKGLVRYTSNYNRKVIHDSLLKAYSSQRLGLSSAGYDRDTAMAVLSNLMNGR